MIPSHDGSTQIDHVIVSRYGVFVVETKNMSGWIYGGLDQRRWTQVIFHKKYQFQNPIHQNYKHVKSLQSILGISSRKIYDIVVFVGNGIPKTEMPPEVFWGTAAAVDFILSVRDPKFQAHEIERIVDFLSNEKFQPSQRDRKQHIRQVKARVDERQNNVRKCPRCGANLVERINRATGERFMGCSRFPACKGSRKLP